MKNTFFFLLILLIFAIPQPQGKANRYIGDIYHLYDHDWSTAEEDQEKGDYLSVYASKQATKTRDGTGGTTVYSTRGMGHASAGVSTQVMGVGDEWSCRSWIQATSASNLVSAPGKGRIPDTVTGNPAPVVKEKFRNNLGIAWALVSFKRGIAALYNKRGIFPGGGLVRVDFDHTKSAEGNFSSEGTPSPLPDLNPWASTSVNIAGRAHVGIAPDINLAEASTPKCTGDEKHDIPLGHGQKCPGIPGQDYTSPDNDLLGQGSIDPPPEPSPPAMHACNVHQAWQSGDHSAAGCGTSGHYACDGSNHAAAGCGTSTHFACDGLTHTQVQCTSTNSSGDQCTYTYWQCLNDSTPSHNHVYPAPSTPSDTTPDCTLCTSGCSACDTDSGDDDQEVYKVCTRWVYRWIWNDLEQRWDYVYEVCGGEFTDNSNAIGSCTPTEGHQE